MKLQDAIDLLTDDKYRPSEITDARFVVLQAARRVANLDYESATDIISRLRYIETGDEWDDKIDDIAAEAVNVALGITTEDDE